MLATDENRPLFTLDDAASLADLQTRFGVAQRVGKLPAAAFRTMDDAALIRSVVDELTTEPLRLHPEQRSVVRVNEVAVSESRTSWDFLDFPLSGYAPGIFVRYAIPYSGRGNLWRLRPRQGWDVVPHGHVEERTPNSGHYEVALLGRGDDPLAEIEAALEAELQKVQACIAEQTPIIEQANAQLLERTTEEVQNRRKRLDLLAALGAEEPKSIPASTPADEPVATPEVVEIIVAPLPAPQQIAAITTDAFEAILTPIRSLGRGLEQHRRVIPKSEDATRDAFLIHLNALFGANTATGETFRKRGKTDIRVGAGDFSAFVAECKLWRGAKYAVTSAITQILKKYTTPLDRHCALLIFNKKVKPDGIISDIEKALTDHPRTTSAPVRVAPGEWRLKIARDGELSAEITLHVFLFDFRPE